MNQNGVWPWREQDRILIPLEQQCRAASKPIPVEIFYSCGIGAARPARAGPRTARAQIRSAAGKYHLAGFAERQMAAEEIGRARSSCQEESWLPKAPPLTCKTICRTRRLQHERTKEAEEFLAAGNTALQKGDPQQARRSFQAAYGLSTPRRRLQRRRPRPAAQHQAPAGAGRLECAPGRRRRRLRRARRQIPRSARAAKKSITRSRTPRTSLIATPPTRTPPSCGWPSGSSSNRMPPSPVPRAPRHHPRARPRAHLQPCRAGRPAHRHRRRPEARPQGHRDQSRPHEHPSADNGCHPVIPDPLRPRRPPLPPSPGVRRSAVVSLYKCANWKHFACMFLFLAVFRGIGC